MRAGAARRPWCGCGHKEIPPALSAIKAKASGPVTGPGLDGCPVGRGVVDTRPGPGRSQYRHMKGWDTMTNEEMIVRNLMLFKEHMMNEYNGATTAKNQAAYKSINYLLARERANALELAMLLFDMYTREYILATEKE
jgi:hypothetical protein